MAKPKKRKKKPGHAPPPVKVDRAAVIEELVQLRAELEDGAEPATWGRTQKLLLSIKADPSETARAVMGRDLPTLDHLLATLQGHETDPLPPEEEETLPEFPEEELRKAMKAFRKRLKLTKLDHESKLGHSPLTSGKDAAFDSILPPNEFDEDIWRVLVKRGSLEELGYGFYRLPQVRPEF